MQVLHGGDGEFREPGAVFCREDRIARVDLGHVCARIEALDRGLHGLDHLADADRLDGVVGEGCPRPQERRSDRDADRFEQSHQNSACRGARGKGMTSRMFCMPVQNWMSRSKPSP